MQITKLVEQATAAYLGLAIGDALGATVEFMTPREIAHHYKLHKEIIGGGWLQLPKGKVTDDTQMSLILGRSIIDTKSISEYRIAEAFSEWMKTNPPDIGLATRRGILRYRKTQQPLDYTEDKQAAGNGACMRLLPIALATFGQSPDTIKNANLKHAHITHPNTLSDEGCYIVIHLIHLILNGEQNKETLQQAVHQWIERNPRFEYRQKSVQNPSGFIVETLQTVFQSFFHTDSFESCLIDVVNRGGDADTTGAIAGMLAGALYGKKSIPLRWLNDLDPAIYQQCTEQALQLMQLSYFQEIDF